MADKNNYFNMNALRSLATNETDERSLYNQMAKEQLGQTQFYRRLLGDDVFNQGVAQYGERPFFKLLESRIGKNPEMVASLMGNSGQFMPDQNGMGPMASRGMLMPRFGVEGSAGQGAYRAGVSLPMAQMQGDAYKSLPKTFDVGYSTPAFGGELNVGGAITPKNQMMKEAMYNLQARFNKRF